MKITQVLQTHFDVVATNPPYLNRMNGDLKKYIKKYYKAYSGDLFSVFIWKNIEMTKQDGYSAYMTPFVWMFIKTYEGLRKSILDSKQISSLIQMEYSAFEEATVPINTFVLKNNVSADSTGTYLKLSDFKGGMEVQKRYVLKAIADPSVSYLYRTKQTNFEKIPGHPIAYWAGPALIHDFSVGKSLGKILDPRQGLATSDNKRFIRMWYEINFRAINFKEHSTREAALSGSKWFPFNKGGAYRRWYGNYDYIINYLNNGEEIKRSVLKKYPYLKTPDFVVKNTRYYFREAITWSDIGSGLLSVRWRSPGSIYGNKGSGAFSSNQSDLLMCMGILNSSVGKALLDIINPTITRNVGDMSKIPILYPSNNVAQKIKKLVWWTKTDWDLDETSWDFRCFPLVQHIAEHQKSPTTKPLIFFEFCGKYVPIQFRGLIFYGQLSKKR